MTELPDALRQVCETAIGAPIDRVRTVSGGDINLAKRLEARSGSFFLKMNTLPHAFDMFQTEARGLELLQQFGDIRVPTVLACGSTGGTAYLLMEFVTPGRRTPAFWETFGSALARLHRTPGEYFGLPHDNYIGNLPQSNSRHEQFAAFYAEQRLQPQMRMAADAGYFSTNDRQRLDVLCHRLDQLIPAEPPALVHGDLWSGNFLADNHDQPVLIDPAVAFSHREVDLAMSRLFGGFDALFYQAYERAYPTQPGLEKRLDLYQLYYLLVHVNLFGDSYVAPVRRILHQVTR